MMKLKGMIILMFLSFIFVLGCSTPGKIWTHLKEHPHKNPTFDKSPISAENRNKPKEEVIQSMVNEYEKTIKFARTTKEEKFADWKLVDNESGGGLEIEDILKVYGPAFRQFREIRKYESKFSVRVMALELYISEDECKLYNLLSYGESEDIIRALKTDDFELVEVITKPSYFKQVFHTCKYFLEKD